MPKRLISAITLTYNLNQKSKRKLEYILFSVTSTFILLCQKGEEKDFAPHWLLGMKWNGGELIERDDRLLENVYRGNN